jgi:hypothetical protein
MFDTAAASKPKFSFFGFDGHFTVGNQNNALRVITGQRRSNAFLPLGLQASFTLHKRKPTLAEAIERADVLDREIFGNPAAGVQAPGTHAALTVNIISVTLTYESVTLKHQSDVDRISKSTLRYFFDAVFMRCNLLADGVLFDHQRVQIPRNAYFLYIIFQRESQFLPSGRANCHLTNRFKFPPNLDELHMNLTGKEGLIFQRGFKGLSLAAGRHSNSLQVYVAELCKAGLYTKGFDDMFPELTNHGIGFDQSILLDLTPYQEDLTQMSTLDVILKYNAAAVPNWYMRVFGIVPACHTYSKSNLWTMVYL